MDNYIYQLKTYLSTTKKYMEKEVKTQKCPDLCPETETETFIFSIAVYRKIANSVFSNRHNYNFIRLCESDVSSQG